MRITSKGQVTIPQAVRERAGLLPHTEVDILIDNGQVVIRPMTRDTPAERVALAIRRSREQGLSENFRGKSADEIMAFLRDD